MLPNLAGVSFDLGGGYTIDTLTHSVTGAGSLSGLNWIGNEANSSDTEAYLESYLHINAVAHYTPEGGPTIPEPGTMLLLGTGLIWCCSFRQEEAQQEIGIGNIPWNSPGALTYPLLV